VPAVGGGVSVELLPHAKPSKMLGTNASCHVVLVIMLLTPS
jgi:hypothetical protein